MPSNQTSSHTPSCSQPKPGCTAITAALLPSCILSDRPHPLKQFYRLWGRYISIISIHLSNSQFRPNSLYKHCSSPCSGVHAQCSSFRDFLGTANFQNLYVPKAATSLQTNCSKHINHHSSHTTPTEGAESETTIRASASTPRLTQQSATKAAVNAAATEASPWGRYS